MAALKMGFTKKLWCGFSVELYACRKDVESSSDGLDMLCRIPCAVKSRPLKNMTPSAGEIPIQAAEGTALPDQPHQSFGSSMLLGLQLVYHKGLKSFRLGGGGELAITDFLNTSNQPCLVNEANRVVDTLMFPCISDFTGVKATDPSTSGHVVSLSQLSLLKSCHMSAEYMPNNVDNDSAASRNWVVAMAWSFLSSIDTWANDL